MTYDVAIIGGSFAGISAGLPLARARRRVAVFDDGMRRNRFAAASHGFLAQDGRPPAEIVAQARLQLAAYPSVEWIEGRVSDVRAAADSLFQVRVGERTCEARRIVLATGVSDELPRIPGLWERWGRSVFHCPYCHGYELDRGRIGVIATGPASLHQAALVAEWGQVSFFLNGAVQPTEEESRGLTRRGVEIEATPIASIAENACVVLEDGRQMRFAGLFTASRTRPASPLAEQLGCEHESGPLGAYVKTGPMKETSVPGVFACGDLARAAGNVAMAVGDGAMAGAGAHASLVFAA
jgi:thioredoxin reductase